MAIEQYITPKEGEDITLVKEDLTHKDAEIANLKQLMIAKEHELEDITLAKENLTLDLTKAKEDLTLKEGEVAHLKQLLIAKEQEGEVRDLAVKERDQLRSEQDLRWKELQQLRSELNQAKREMETARSKENQLISERDQAKSSEEKVSGELVALTLNLEHHKETLQLKEEEISFLRGHVAQLTQSISQFALKPGEEEIRVKHWYQFWK